MVQNIGDAVLILGVPGILVSLYLGLRKGAHEAAKAPPPEPISAITASILDAATARELVNVLRDLTAAIREGTEAEDQRARDVMDAKLDRLVKIIEAKERAAGG